MPKRINKKDFDHIAQFIKDEKDTRKGNRKELDNTIRELDRQLAMRPKTDHKMKIGPSGEPTAERDPMKAWLPEIELPLQAEALETLMADSRSMQFPDSGPWFKANAALTDEYLREIDLQSIITGDENEVPSQITQDNANKLVQGYINHLLRQYDFRGNIDQINAEALSYGVGVGRMRMVTKAVIMETSRGMIKQDQKIPVLIPRSLKETYLDDRTYALMHEGHMVGPMTIFERIIKLEDLKKESTDNTDPNHENGGWVPSNIRKLQENKNGDIELLEAEGDFVIPRKSSGNIFLPGTIFTIAVGNNEPTVIRARFRKHSHDSVLTFPYHQESVGVPYAPSPLKKGLPIQAAATEALMRLVEASALNARPPVGYDRSDTWFAQQGGPNIEPGALWATISDLSVHNIGDVGALFAVYEGFLRQYADAVGMHRARLGAQTVSHTTAFAKNAEIQRGQVRTVDYVRGTLNGPLTKFLYMVYELGRENFKKSTFYIDSYGGFVTLDKKDQLPDLVQFEAHGSGGPAEEQQKQAEKLAAIDRAIQIDNLAIQRGGQPTLDLTAVIQQTLQEGGWADTDVFIRNTEEGPQLPSEVAQALSA